MVKTSRSIARPSLEKSEEEKKLQKDENKETVYFVKFKPKTPKKEVAEFESKLDKLVKNNPYITIRKTK